MHSSNTSSLNMVGVIDIAELIKSSPFELTDVDKAVLNTAEQDFAPHSWDDIKAVIGECRQVIPKIPSA